MVRLHAREQGFGERTHASDARLVVGGSDDEDCMVLLCEFVVKRYRLFEGQDMGRVAEGVRTSDVGGSELGRGLVSFFTEEGVRTPSSFVCQTEVSFRVSK